MDDDDLAASTGCTAAKNALAQAEAAFLAAVANVSTASGRVQTEQAAFGAATTANQAAIAALGEATAALRTATEARGTLMSEEGAYPADKYAQLLEAANAAVNGATANLGRAQDAAATAAGSLDHEAGMVTTYGNDLAAAVQARSDAAKAVTVCKAAVLQACGSASA